MLRVKNRQLLGFDAMIGSISKQMKVFSEMLRRDGLMKGIGERSKSYILVEGSRELQEG